MCVQSTCPDCADDRAKQNPGCAGRGSPRRLAGAARRRNSTDEPSRDGSNRSDQPLFVGEGNSTDVRGRLSSASGRAPMWRFWAGGLNSRLLHLCGFRKFKGVIARSDLADDLAEVAAHQLNSGRMGQ